MRQYSVDRHADRKERVVVVAVVVVGRNTGQLEGMSTRWCTNSLVFRNDDDVGKP